MGKARPGQISKTNAHDRKFGDELSTREIEVLRLLADGQQTKQIAKALDISPHTVKFHVDNCMTKLGTKTRLHAVVKFVRANP